MRLKKVTKLKKLSESEANRLSDAYIKEKYITEIIPTTIGKWSGDLYELHVYKIIKREARWYTFDYKFKL